MTVASSSQDTGAEPIPTIGSSPADAVPTLMETDEGRWSPGFSVVLTSPTVAMT